MPTLTARGSEASACGFYPGMEPGQHLTGVAESFEDARAGFGGLAPNPPGTD